MARCARDRRLSARRLLVALLSLLGCPAHAGKRIPQYAGPYIVFAEQFASCKDEAKLTPFYVKLSHFNPSKPFQKQSFSGNLSVTREIDDNLWVRVVLDTFSNNQWKPNAFKFNFPGQACSALREHIPDGFAVVFGHPPMTPNCVIAKAMYRFNDSVAWVFPHFPVMPYGRYRFNLRMGEHKPDAEAIYCVAVVGQIIPRPR